MIAVGLTACHDPDRRDAGGTGAASGDWVANAACVECHPSEAAAWRASHHAMAMAPATAASVRGDFDGATFVRDGVTTRFLRRGDAFVVHTEGSDGRTADFDVAYTFGVDPLQQYLLPLPGGRLQAFTVAWDTARKRWFDLQPDEKTPPGDVLHWTGRYETWNTMCASCHATNLVKGYDATADAFHTSWSEIAVTCQSCHGPGARHVAWAHAGDRTGDDGLVPVASDAEREIETCAPCHARRAELLAAPVPGAPLYDGYLPSVLTQDLYHADGQQRGEVYVYGSYRQTRMYQAGVRCTDCHDAHSSRLRADGDALCVRCHQEAPDAVRFPGLLPNRYDAPAHHHHEPGSAGARCVACHMPERNYMVVDARRDHAIRVPRPDLSAKLGTPDACTGCHADRTAQWAADAVVRWYGPERRRGATYGEAIAAGRAGKPGAGEALRRIVDDRAQPAIVRATAIELLARQPTGEPSSVASATRDEDPAVRVAAVRALEQAPPPARAALVGPLLADPRRAVRIEAARVLSSARAALDPSGRAAYAAAIAEFRAAQAVALDTPGAHLNLAVVSQNEGDSAGAEAEFRRALRLDPDFTPARLDLAQMLSADGRGHDAEAVLREGVGRVPAEGELHYSLALLLAEGGDLVGAEAELGRAAELLPERGRVRYNHALALQRLGRLDDAERELERALELDPGDRQIVYAAVVLYGQRGEWSRALAMADRLAASAPDDPAVQAFVADVRRAYAADARAGRVTN